ncbi:MULTISPECIES: DUF1145 domain-containing protein [unclassified Shewanella]|uniref:DUF1145 domain-containing protein n=1 Tax=unclassified Shewanella TaxID=196818 RepID=UPI000C832F65|nr:MULTISPECIES: DUF1145 domain-containing protein [unclassified Shewanella]MDO6641992.1 DUF1145 domain-containing protein [Shewanella sp. 5_MG-2023]MDO6680640.1 DUF1145 domain-containing protein [Shewanella sp. 4_MG-2023]PMG26005.1 hypothetical protein BCU94_06370 [Shewanella sp. 10N.286.52.C2]PMG44715.1 hypothetical protein BCU91_19820 [Shewanella sp. 10N.286.52.B9]
MKFFIIGGKSLTLIMWLVMFYNLFMPFEGQVSIVLNILFFITVIMHFFQLLIFNTMFSSLLKLSVVDYLKVYFFGVFGLLEYRQKVLELDKAE